MAMAAIAVILIALLVVACSDTERRHASSQFQEQIRQEGFQKQNEEYRERVTPMVDTPFQRGP